MINSIEPYVRAEIAYRRDRMRASWAYANAHRSPRPESGLRGLIGRRVGHVHRPARIAGC